MSLRRYKKELSNIIDFIDKELDVELITDNRKRINVMARALYTKIALETTKATYEDIAHLIRRDHSTINHMIGKVMHHVDGSREHMEVYGRYLESLALSEELELSSRQVESLSLMEATKKIEFLEVRLLESTSRYKVLENRMDTLSSNTIRKDSTDLTENEICYRDLSYDQRSTYDDRVKLILRSFRWKENNHEMEIINCHA